MFLTPTKNTAQEVKEKKSIYYPPYKTCEYEFIWKQIFTSVS